MVKGVGATLPFSKTNFSAKMHPSTFYLVFPSAFLQHSTRFSIGYAEKGDYPAPIYTGFIYAFYINRIV
jgi:hypothetical protein